MCSTGMSEQPRYTLGAAGVLNPDSVFVQPQAFTTPTDQPVNDVNENNYFVPRIAKHTPIHSVGITQNSNRVT